MALPPPVKGRGATGNAASARFDVLATEPDGDWLDAREMLGDLVRLRTTVSIERPRTIITRNTSPDIPFDRSVNAYRGCEHGCIYCFARPTHAYLGLSPGLDFETRLTAKPTAPDLLRAELSKRGYAPKPLAMGTNTDPYQPIEADFRITRALLEVLLDFGHPVTITTKSDRVLADLDLLRKRRLHPPHTLAARSRAVVPRLARRPLPRTCCASPRPHPVNARRPRQ